MTNRGRLANVRNRAGMTLLDLMVLLFSILILMAFLTPATRHCREDSSRVKCASNLRQIGQAIMMYANENKGAYPRTRWNPSLPQWPAFTNPKAANPFTADGPAENDVTAAWFLLLRTQDITSEIFICEKTSDEKMDSASLTAQSNFDGPENLSYSFANPFPDEQVAKAGYALTSSMAPDFAIAADKNPGESALKAYPTAPTSKMREANSPNHDDDGENVLYADGHVDFVSNPFVGIQKDNIYTYGSVTASTGGTGIVGSPAGINDSVLLPALKNKKFIIGAGISGETWQQIIVYSARILTIGLLVAILLFSLRKRASSVKI